MIRHIVWWTLKSEAKGRTAQENAWHIVQASSMLQGIPGVLSLEVSNQIEPSTTVPAQVILSSTHASMDDLEAYKINPVHVQFAEMLGELSNSRQAIDYKTD